MCCAQPVRNVALGCDHALLDAGRRSNGMTTDAEDAFAPVIVLDLENRRAVRPRVVGVDQIDWTRGLKSCELPTDKSGDHIHAAFRGHAVRSLPFPAPCNIVRYL